MSDRVDDLFGGTDSPSPNSARVIGLSVAGVGLTLLGMLCCAFPGGILTLWAYFEAGKDQDRLDNGYLPRDHRNAVRRNYNIALLALGLTLVLFLLQFVLICTGFYDSLFEAYLPVWRSLVKTLLIATGAAEPVS